MVKFMKEIGIMEKDQEVENTYIQIKVFTMDNGKVNYHNFRWL